MRPAISFALLLTLLCLPLQADPAVSSARPTPRIQLAVTLAWTTTSALTAAQTSPRTISIDQVTVSRRPWGEARLEHLDLQVVSGKEAQHLLAALSKTQPLGTPALSIVPSGGADTIMHSERTSQSRRFLLHPRLNPDGSITLSFASDDNFLITTNAASVEKPEDARHSFTDIGTVHSGETFALTGMESGPHLVGAEVAVAFVTPTIL